jgi:hypothetical protein
MTVKKTISLKRPVKTQGDQGAEQASSSAAPSGGATIADRFKLDTAEPAKKAADAGAGTKIAVIAALIALAVAGILTYTLYGHWEFLKGA